MDQDVGAALIQPALEQLERQFHALKVEDVVAKASLREPEIPDPTIVQLQDPWSYRRAGGEAITGGFVGPTRAGNSFR